MRKCSKCKTELAYYGKQGKEVEFYCSKCDKVYVYASVKHTKPKGI